MFDELERKLRELEQGVNISIDVPLDDDGYVDRMCPAEHCRTAFKVLYEDWKNKVADDRAHCPFCKHEAPKPGTTWGTPQQNEHAEKVGYAHIKGVIDSALEADARSFNRRQRRQPKTGFLDLSMSASFKPDAPPLIVPIEAADALRQRFTCESCGCGYASLGASFFCPACGHNSAASTFDGTLETVRKIVTSLSAVRQAVAKAEDEDTAQDSVRQLLEDQFSRVVGAFERLNEALFLKLPSASQQSWHGNVFQRVDDSSALWATATGSGYDAFLSPTELDALRRFVQQRHVLGHRQGVVDQRYIDVSGDTTYAVGQRLVVRDADVLALVDIVSRLAAGLRTLFP